MYTHEMDKRNESECIVLKDISNTTYVVEIKKSDFESLPIEEKLLNIVVERILKAS